MFLYQSLLGVLKVVRVIDGVGNNVVDIGSGAQECSEKIGFTSIFGVKKNPNGPMYTSRGVITKDTIIEARSMPANWAW
ncbi:hypothetical protein Ancab_015199 [Ancistrocladus abbreviatus]